MDPQSDPKIDPARLTMGDPCQLKALKGPSKVQVDQSFFIDLKTTEKLKDTAWFEVNRTSGQTWKKFLALLQARGEYSFSSDTFGIIFRQSVSKM